MLTDALVSVARFFAAPVRSLTNAESPDNWFVEWVRGGEETSAGEYINEENALKCPAMKAAVGILCETIASCPIEIVREEKSGAQVVVTDHPVSVLLNRAPNPETARTPWKHKLQEDLGLYGNCYAVIQTGITGGVPMALWQRPANPSRTKPVRYGKELWYELRDEKGQPEEAIPASQMLHVQYLSPDGIVGRSPVRLLKESLGGNRAAERYANEIFKNSGSPEGYYKFPGRLSDKAYERLRASLASRSEHGERHKTHLLEEGGDFQAVALNPQETQMLDSRKFLVNEIARFYRIALYLMQMLDAGATPDVTELGRQFVTYTMAPWFEMWCGEIDRKLLKPPFKSRFNAERFLLGDYVQMATFIRAGFSVGSLSVNEARQKMGLNPLAEKNANEHWVPLNMVPLSQADQQKQPPANEKQPGGVHPGDGVNPAAPDPGKEADSPKNQSAVDGVLRDTLDRMARIEANAVLRAAKDPRTFGAKVEAFYEKQAMRVSVACKPLGEAAVEQAVALSAERRKASIEASECKASELYDRISALVETWKPTEEE